MGKSQPQPTGQDEPWGWIIASHKALPLKDRWQFLAKRKTTDALFHLLAERGEMYRDEIAKALALTPPGAVHAMKSLMRRGFIKSERRGRYRYYWLEPEAIAEYKQWLALQPDEP